MAFRSLRIRSMGSVTGVLLAGGQGRRMGGVDKGLQPFRGKPLAQWAIERFAPQVDELIINANQNPEAYARCGHRVVPDELTGFAGPLAGLHAGLKAAGGEFVATVPCDSPFLPSDLVARLRCALGDNDLAVAKTGSQAHPVFALARRSVLPHLEAYLARGGRKIDDWYATLKVVEVAFDDEAEAFRNLNTREELERE
ncbi:MAG: molybdenum cofactor guanylyltransferase MobA [Betaproteobacteria bacterium RIFCSPLOWO2_12_FULL_67_28]|nr:MAG: molybdenum cofactor guanylyltransferase MobA [Betaproteobacteria bacterium RIFCSPLOWO2_12_FULL_67_28]